MSNKPKTNDARFELRSDGEKFLTASSYPSLRTAIDQAEIREEQVVAIFHEINCFPADGVVAFNRALQNVFGFTLAKASFSRPPQTINIETSLGKTESFFYGTMIPPSLEKGFFQVELNLPVGIILSGQIKRKFEDKTQELVAEIKRILREESIYRGKACEITLGQNVAFPMPKFIDVQPVTLILNRATESRLSIDLWARLKNPIAFRKNNVSMKRGILCSGVYGTGKSLTASKTAHIATENGWTFLSLKKLQGTYDFVEAYKLCQLYAPSVLFVEDIDAITSGIRGSEMNDMLETMDGVGAKGKEVVVVFTTNFPEKINDAFMRSGRIDRHVKLGLPDLEGIAHFVVTIGGNSLTSDCDIPAVCKAFEGLVPADICEGIDGAKALAIETLPVGKWNIDGLVTTEMLLNSAESMRDQRGLISNKIDANEKALSDIRKGFRLALIDGEKVPQTKVKVS